MYPAVCHKFWKLCFAYEKLAIMNYLKLGEKSKQRCLQCDVLCLSPEFYEVFYLYQSFQIWPSSLRILLPIHVMSQFLWSSLFFAMYFGDQLLAFANQFCLDSICIRYFGYHYHHLIGFTYTLIFQLTTCHCHHEIKLVSLEDSHVLEWDPDALKLDCWVKASLQGWSTIWGAFYLLQECGQGSKSAHPLFAFSGSFIHPVFKEILIKKCLLLGIGIMEIE